MTALDQFLIDLEDALKSGKYNIRQDYEKGGQLRASIINENNKLFDYAYCPICIVYHHKFGNRPSVYNSNYPELATEINKELDYDLIATCADMSKSTKFDSYTRTRMEEIFRRYS